MSDGLSAASDLRGDAEAFLLLLLKALSSPNSDTTRLSPTCFTAAARALFLLRVILSGNGLSFTERDLYYTNPALFGSQGQRAVHQSLERLCKWMQLGSLAMTAVSLVTLGPVFLHYLFTSPARAFREAEQHALRHSCRVTGDAGTKPLHGGQHTVRWYTRDHLGVSAAPRSILVGPIAFSCNGRTVSVSQSGNEGILVSSALARASLSVVCTCAGSSDDPAPSPVLVFVEKECTLRHMQDALSRLTAVKGRSFIFLCTKGYPCIASRQMLRRIHEQCPALPMVGLVDGDPHGLQILLTLITPLPTQRPEQTPERVQARTSDENLTDYLPVRWLGIKPSTVAHNAKSTQRPAKAALSERDSVMVEGLRGRLTALVKASTGAALPPSVRPTVQTVRDMLAEVEWMATTRVKCELQAGDPVALLLSSCSSLANDS